MEGGLVGGGMWVGGVVVIVCGDRVWGDSWGREGMCLR